MDTLILMFLLGLRPQETWAGQIPRPYAHYTTPSRGGDGAARDAVEYILKAQGKLDKVIESYIADRS